MHKYDVLPFNFRYIEAIDKFLLTTINGNFCFLNDIEQIQSIASNNIDKLDSLTINQLLVNNILAEKVELDAKVNIISSNYASVINSTIYGSILVLIIPTLRCDHDCGYCQVSRVPLNEVGYDFTVDSIDNAIKYLKKLNVPSLKIEFQGGEPLLNKAYIKQFYEKAIQVLGDNTSFVICSALGPLDLKFIQWTRDKNITYSTSLDGEKNIHELNRLSRQFDSHQKTVEGIKLIQKELGYDKINALATITKKSMEQPHELINEYLKIGFESIFLRPLSPLGFAYKNQGIEYSPEAYINFYKQCMDYIFEINKKNIFKEETAVIYLKKILFPETSGYVDLQSPSGLFLNALVINYDGNIFGSDESRMLWEMTKNNDLVSGNISNSQSTPISEININLLADTFLTCVPGCDDCAYQPYCGADPLYHLSTQGDHIGDKAISDYCKLQRYLFDYFFEILNDDEKRGVIINWLK